MGLGRIELDQVKTALQEAPKGLTISGVSEKLHISRNSAAKYLEILSISGEVRMRTFGRSKIYRLSNKVPLATALSLSSELIVFIDNNLRVIDANDQFLRFVGVERTDIAGFPLEELNLDLLSHRDILLNVKDALRGLEFFREISITRGNDLYFFSVKLIPVSSREHEPDIAIIYRNITARKKAEIALKESEARYRAVVEDQSDLIVRFRPDMTVTFANTAFYTYFGVTREELPDKKLIDGVTPFYRTILMRDLGRIGKEKPSLTVEVNDGARQWVLVTHRGIFNDRKQLIEYQIVARDISEMKQAETALIESEKKLRAAFDQSPIGACIVSLDYRFVRVNPMLCQITGYREAELLSMTFPEITHPDDIEREINLARELVAGQAEQYHIETRCIRKDGRITWLSKHASLVKDISGKPLYILPMLEDITDKKQMEESLLLTQYSTDNAPVGIIWADPSGQLLYVNDIVCRKLKYTRETLQGMKAWDINPAYNPEKWVAQYAELKNKLIMKYECSHVASDNTMVPLEVNVNYIQFGCKEYYCVYAEYL